MAVPTSTEPSLAKSILSQIDLLVREAEETQKPLELDPLRVRQQDAAPRRTLVAHAALVVGDAPVDGMDLRLATLARIPRRHQALGAMPLGPGAVCASSVSGRCSPRLDRAAVPKRDWFAPTADCLLWCRRPLGPGRGG
jgi:hypothetical protein